MNSSNSLSRCRKRLEKEKEDFLKNYLNEFVLDIDNSNPFIWYISFTGAKGSLYENENYKLRFKFGPEYVCVYFI